MSKSVDLLGRSPQDVALRLLLSLVAGYGLSALCAAALPHALPATPADAVLGATMLSFLIFPAVVIWVFHVNNWLRVMAGLAVPLLLLSGVFWLNVKGSML